MADSSILCAFNYLLTMSFSLPQNPSSWRDWLVLSSSTVFIVADFYCYLCASLRHQWLEQMYSRYQFSDRASLSKMTNLQAQEIVKGVYYHEFPTFYYLGLMLAILKVRTL